MRLYLVMFLAAAILLSFHSRASEAEDADQKHIADAADIFSKIANGEKGNYSNQELAEKNIEKLLHERPVATVGILARLVWFTVYPGSFDKMTANWRFEIAFGVCLRTLASSKSKEAAEQLDILYALIHDGGDGMLVRNALKAQKGLTSSR